MSKRLVFPVLALVAMSLGASFNGCSCGGEAKVGNMEAKQPEPPPPPPPPPPPAPTQDPAPPPPKQVKVVKNVQMDGNKVKIPGELEFDVDKATLKNTQQSTDILNTLVQFMKENQNVTKLRIEGHTDNSGSNDHNMKLSNDRAAAVAKWLGDHGVEAARLKTVGYGPTKQLVPNDSAEHKAMNRRTEFHVEEIDGKPAPSADSGSGGSGGATADGSGGGTTPAAAGTAAAGDKTSSAAPGAPATGGKSPKAAATAAAAAGAGKPATPAATTPKAAAPASTTK